MSFLQGIGKVPSSSLVVPAGACIAGGVVGGLILHRMTCPRGAADKLPEKWVKVGEIKELLIYPVKSLRGISVNEAVIARLGLKGADNPLVRDRVFVIVGADGKCITMRKKPILALIQVTIEGRQLHLSYIKDKSLDIQIDIPSSNDPNTERSADIFGEKVSGVDCGDKVAAWLAKLMEAPDVRLVYHLSDEPLRHAMKRNTRFHTYRENHTGTFHDETSYMIMTEESLAALNAELETPVTHTNFRPSMVVQGISEPFSEDFWGYVKIGEDGPVLKSSIPCQRCTQTTVNPETGEFRTDGEPLKTLYKLKRKVGDDKITKLVTKAAILGSHFGVFENEGKTVSVGDPIYAALL